jgi:flagellar biosynthesis/type III secretory pathway M-ring protein FliF/YscJ
MKSSLKLPVTTNNNQPDKENNSKTKESTSALPTYAIVLIVVGSVIVLLLILFFIYIKLKRKNISLLNFKSKRTEQMQEVWAIPDATNTQNLSELDKPKDSNNEEAHTRRESFASKILSNNLQKIEST